MTWVRRDDHADESGKVLALSDKAYRAWNRSISYSSRDLTDGWVWAAVWPMYAPAKTRRELIDAGFWHPHDALCEKCLHHPDRTVVGNDGAIYVHDYLDFNPPRTKVLEKRAAESARKAKQGASSVTRIPAQGDEPRPVPSRPSPKNGKAKPLRGVDNQPDHDQMYLDDRIAAAWEHEPIGVKGLQRLNSEFGRVAVISAMRQLHGFPPATLGRAYGYITKVCQAATA